MFPRPMRWLAFATLFGLLTLGVVRGVTVVASQLRPSDLRPTPALTDVSATDPRPGVFTVAGQGFTPGGRVYLAIYDPMGAKLYETRWVTATPAIRGVGHVPGDGPRAQPVVDPGGAVRETFANLCGATAMMRALDSATATWSNGLAVEPACPGDLALRVDPH